MPKNASNPQKIEAKIKKLEDKANLPQGERHNDQHPNEKKRGTVITQEDRNKLRVAIEGLKNKLAKIRAAPQEGISRAASHAGTSYGGHSAAPSEFGASASQAGNGKAGKASHKIVATNKTWAMIPPPTLDAKAYTYIGSGVDINNSLLAYESYSMDRATRTFYVKSGDHLHIAYLPFENGLSIEHSALKTESENLNSTNPGYIYHSGVYEYQQGDVKKHGYITLLIPFVHHSVSSDQAGEYVCAVRTIDHDSSNINSTSDLLQTYKEYIFSSSIPANSTITQLERLKKDILDLTNSKIPRELHRTDNKLSDQVVRSHLTLKDQKKLHIQIAIAYTNKEIAEHASKLIRSIIFTMRKMVNAKVWRRAATQSIFGLEPLKVTTWDNEHSVQIYTHLWTCTTWLLVKELCHETMNIGRTVEMTKIFNTFVNTYVAYKTYPDKETLKKWYEYRQAALTIPMTPATSKPKNLDLDRSTLRKEAGSEVRDW